MTTFANSLVSTLFFFYTIQVINKLFKNVGYLWIAQIAVKVISFFYTIYLAKILGVSQFGLFTTALAYFALLSSVVDLGFSQYLTREGAHDETRLSDLLISVSLMRFVLTGLLFGLFVFWLSSFDHDSQRVSLSVMAAFAVIPQSFALTFDAFLVAKQKLFYSALGILALSIGTTLTGIYFTLQNPSPFAAVSALVCGETIYLICLLLFVLNNKVIINLVKFGQIKSIIKGSLPYGILGVLGLLYFRIDTLILNYMKGAYETGLYGAAYKFLEAILFVPSGVATAMFPLIVKLYRDDPHKIRKVYFSSIKILGLLSIPITLSYLFILPVIIRFLLPQYSLSVQAIQILSFTIPFMFLHVPGAQILFSTEKYLAKMIFFSVITLSFNIIGNLVLIPGYGYVGASIITVLSEALSFVIFFLILYSNVLKEQAETA